MQWKTSGEDISGAFGICFNDTTDVEEKTKACVNEQEMTNDVDII